MKITLTDAGKRFNREWIFRHFNGELISGQAYAITGPNGSGKSTLLQVIAGAIQPSEGEISYQSPQTIVSEEWYRYMAFAAPYLELIEEMTLLEFLEFHKTFKPFLPGIDNTILLQTLSLSHAAHKQIRYYSSGMKQRVKLAQAIFSDTPVILLDEPCTNLDEEGIALYRSLVDRYCKAKLVVVSSNDKQEYDFCQEVFSITKYK